MTPVQGQRQTKTHHTKHYARWICFFVAVITAQTEYNYHNAN